MALLMEPLESQSFRYDGNSPLPLGMEWSSPSTSESNSGRMWATVPPEAWSFTASIPSWVSASPQAHSSAGQGPLQMDSLHKPAPLVLYRVVVTVRSPRATTTNTRLLRRFSHFLKLHSALVREFPEKHIANPPPRHRLLFVSSNNTLISQRRLDLEKWIIHLMEDLEVSRSLSIAAFMELSEAARAAALALDAQGSQGHLHERAASEAGSSQPTEQGDSLSQQALEAYLSKRQGAGGMLDSGSDAVRSELPSPSPPSSLYRALSGSSLGSLPPGLEQDTRHAEAQVHPAFREKATENLSSNERPAHSEVGSSQEKLELDHDDTAGESTSVSVRSQQEQAEEANPDSSWSARDRPNVVPGFQSRRSERVEAEETSGGLEDSSRALGEDGVGVGGIEPPTGLEKALQEDVEQVLVLSAEKRPAVMRHLAALHRRLQVAQADMTALLERLQQEAAVSDFLSRKVKDVEAELDYERRHAATAVHQGTAELEEHMVAVEWQLEEERGKLAEAQAALSCLKEEQQNLKEKLKVAENEKAAAVEEAEAQRQRLLTLNQEHAAEISSARQEAEQARAEESTRLKGEVKVLAKEVKALRRALAASEADAAHANQQVAAYQALASDEDHWSSRLRERKERLMHEVDVLAKRLRETAVTSLAAEASSQDLGRGSDQVGAEITRLSENVEMLSTSDARIDVIVAEARLLQELSDWEDDEQARQNTDDSVRGLNIVDGSMNGDTRSDGGKMERLLGLPERQREVHKRRLIDYGCDKEIMYTTLGLLIENGNQRKSLNTLLRHAFMSSEWKQHQG